MKRRLRHQKIAKKARVRRAKSGGRRSRRICITYDIVSPQEEDDEYPATESGWENEAGVPVTLDRYDREAGRTYAKVAAKMLRYDGRDGAVVGAVLARCVVLDRLRQGLPDGRGEAAQLPPQGGFTTAEEREIYDLVYGKRQHERIE